MQDVKIKRFPNVILTSHVLPLGMVSWKNYGIISFTVDHIYRIYDFSSQ